MRKIIITAGLVTGLAFWIAQFTGGVNADWGITLGIVGAIIGNLYIK